MKTYSLPTLLLLFIVFLGSCRKNIIEPEEEEFVINVSVEHIGHQYAYFECENIIGYSQGGDNKLYYDTINYFNQYTPYVETSISYYNHPKILDLKPGKTYYIKATYHDIVSEVIQIQTLPHDLSCALTNKWVTGDRSAHQFGFNDLKFSSERLHVSLNGDFKEITARFPEYFTGELQPGVYTTSNTIQDSEFDENINNVRLSFTTYGDTVYYAEMDQPVEISNNFFYSYGIQFCNLKFFNDYGDEIVLSAELE